jgi:sporadic carbohydrate cluster protein (TIGR04323 family)
MIFTSERLTFDTQQFNFAGLMHDEINSYLAANDCAPLATLEQIHHIEGIHENLEQYRQLLFSLFRTERFQRVYCALARQLIDEHFTPQALVQKTPTVRIHLPGGVSVSFHSDAWYGHGRQVYSFWLPVTNVFGSNSLQMARSVDESRALLCHIAQQQLDLDEINNHAARLCQSITAKFGELIVFDSDMVHGTITNNTGLSRVSFDFRIAEGLEHTGNKPAANFYAYSQLAGQGAAATQPAAPKRSFSALMYSGTCRGISAKSQVIFLNEYARINDIRIIGSESEVIVFDYAPVLQKYVKRPTSNMDSILLFGVDLLPDDPRLRRNIYNQAIESGVTIIFAAEDIRLSSDSDVERVEQFFRHSRQAA